MKLNGDADSFKAGDIPLSPVTAYLLILSLSALLFTAQVSASDLNTYLPVEPGTGWELQDDMGRFQIEIREKEVVGNREYYRVDWIDEKLGGRYQSEYWLNNKDGIYAAGRAVMGRAVMFEQPYLLLKHRLTIGEKWTAQINSSLFSDTVGIHVETREVIKTGIGALEAVKVVFTGRALRIERWYSKGIGIVKETSFKKGKDGFELVNEKVLAKRITRAGSQKNNRGGAAVFTDQDLERYSIGSDSAGQGEPDAASLNAPQKKINHEFLAGTWWFKDEDHETVFTLSPDGKFSGSIRKQDKIFWHYSGMWTVAGDRLVWIYGKNTPERVTPGTKDDDEIIVVDDHDLILQEGKTGEMSRFWRSKSSKPERSKGR